MSGPPVYSFRKKVTETNEFKYTNSVSALETITVPATGTNDFIIDWGDGSGTEVVTTSSPSHEYVDADSYQISIDGDMSLFTFNNGGSKLNIDSLDQWGNMGLTSLSNSFLGCSNMTSIPNAPITGADSVVNCLSIFRNTAISSIPTGLFDNLINAIDLGSAFGNTNITSIPTGLFDNNTLVVTLSAIFTSTNITSIPTGLFDENTLVTTFANLFQNTSITSIPTGLFDNNTLVTTFLSVFSGSQLAAIPSGLFDNNTLVTTFADAFKDTSITAIPSGLFDNNTLVTNFSTTFQDASSLTSIPNNLFINNALVTSYLNVFLFVGGGITLPSTIFTLSNLSIVTNFNSAFGALSPGFSGTAQDIWNFALSATSLNTYFNQTNISNYADIPNDWKGL